MKFIKLSTKNDYESYIESEKEILNYQHFYAKSMLLDDRKDFKVRGYSWTAEKEVMFECRYPPDNKKQINWRETLKCPETNLNNRSRFSQMAIDIFGNVSSESNIYLMEQTTSLYKFLKKNYDSLTGSEFLDKQCKLGSYNKDGIRNEDATDLSFKSNSLDLVLSFDVFEHVPDFIDAFKECNRVLKDSGSMIFSVPFNPKSDTNIIRSQLKKDGSIEHLLKPQYHGDPTTKKGILCFQDFGWEVLENLKNVGFASAYVIAGSSIPLANFGTQLIIVANKNN